MRWRKSVCCRGPHVGYWLRRRRAQAEAARRYPVSSGPKQAPRSAIKLGLAREPHFCPYLHLQFVTRFRTRDV